MLKANPHSGQVRLLQLIRWGMTAAVVLAVALAAYMWWRYPDPAQAGGYVGLIVFFVGCWLVCFVSFSPPRVTANAERVSVWGFYGAWLLQRLQRSDLAYVFRGQALMGRYKTWRPAYFLVTRDDTPRVTIAADDFADDGMTELAKRLQVPIKGDFSAQVR